MIDLAEDYDSREAGFGVAWDCWMEDIDALEIVRIDIMKEQWRYSGEKCAVRERP